MTTWQDSDEVFELLAKASTDAFWTWVPGSEIVTRSEPYLPQFGYISPDVGDELNWWRERIHADDRGRVLEVLEVAVEDPEAAYDESYRFRRADGTYGYLRSRGFVIYDEVGEPEQMVGAHIDITDQRTRERELKRQNERLEEFANVVSHDLRNPLTVAQGQLELVKEEYTSERLDIVVDALSRMEDLIKDTLRLARQGRSIGEVTTVDVDSLARQSWEIVTTADATLIIEGDLTIEADQSRLRTLFENLFRNAVQHGGNDIVVRVGPLSDAKGFFVADNGPGIASDDRDDAFEPGFSIANEGTGFGLAIVKEIAEAHEWSIRVTASESGGARFEISNP